MRGRKPRPKTTLPVRVSRSTANVQATPQADEAVPAQSSGSSTLSPTGDTTLGSAVQPAVSRRNAVLAGIGGIGALILAGLGEAIVESGNTTVFSLILYFAAIGLFSWSATLIPPSPGDLPSESTPPDRPIKGDRVTWVILGAGIGLAILLDVMTFFMLRDDLKSELGKWLWLISLAVIMATGIALHKRHSWPARWSGNGWPQVLSGRVVVIVAIVVIALAAIAARFLALDTVPLGINADEGDRAATAIQILRQTNTESVFGNGWYQIAANDKAFILDAAVTAADDAAVQARVGWKKLYGGVAAMAVPVFSCAEFEFSSPQAISASAHPAMSRRAEGIVMSKAPGKEGATLQVPSQEGQP